MNVVETFNLTKNYEVHGLTVKALQGVSMAFEQGEFTAVAGPSGSGKSTLLHLVGCLDTPTAGTIRVNEIITSTMKRNDMAYLRRKTIGFIFQAYNLIPVLTANENISLPLILLGEKRDEAMKRSSEVLSLVGLEGYENRKPKEMSGGQQQRVAIARALIKKPSLILADEPTANLDTKTAREILELMFSINKKDGTTFIFSTHDTIVMDYAKRLIKLRDGMIEDEVYK